VRSRAIPPTLDRLAACRRRAPRPESRGCRSSWNFSTDNRSRPVLREGMDGPEAVVRKSWRRSHRHGHEIRHFTLPCTRRSRARRANRRRDPPRQVRASAPASTGGNSGLSSAALRITPRDPPTRAPQARVIYASNLQNSLWHYSHHGTPRISSSCRRTGFRRWSVIAFGLRPKPLSTDSAIRGALRVARRGFRGKSTSGRAHDFADPTPSSTNGPTLKDCECCRACRRASGGRRRCSSQGAELAAVRAQRRRRKSAGWAARAPVDRSDSRSYEAGHSRHRRRLTRSANMSRHAERRGSRPSHRRRAPARHCRRRGGASPPPASDHQAAAARRGRGKIVLRRSAAPTRRRLVVKAIIEPFTKATRVEGSQGGPATLGQAAGDVRRRQHRARPGRTGRSSA